MINKNIAIYSLLTTFFTIIIVVGNIIFQKIISINLFFSEMEISIAVLLFPISFLISDLVTEFFGKKYAALMIIISLLTSIIIMMIIWLFMLFPANDHSIISDEEFNKIFNLFSVATLLSIFANFIAQIIDVIIFDYIKKITNNKYLWLRNNVSTITAQFIDSFIIIYLLVAIGTINTVGFYELFIGTFTFKLIAALFDTPFCYLGHYFFKKYNINFNLESSKL